MSFERCMQSLQTEGVAMRGSASSYLVFHVLSKVFYPCSSVPPHRNQNLEHIFACCCLVRVLFLKKPRKVKIMSGKSRVRRVYLSEGIIINGFNRFQVRWALLPETNSLFRNVGMYLAPLLASLFLLIVLRRSDVEPRRLLNVRLFYRHCLDFLSFYVV